MKVGIISPSAGIMGLYPKRAERGLQWLQRQGWEAFLGKHAMERLDYISSSPEDRVADIHRFLDSDIDVIMASIGGYNSNQLLPLLDYDKISSANKIFCGYSDVTALLLAAAIKGGSRCIYGPTFLPEICEYPHPHIDTIDCLKQVLSGKRFTYTCPQETVSEYIDWAEEETGNCREKNRATNYGWAVLQKGCASGPIWGGNLQTLLWILGTEYFPTSTLDGAIFFIEDLEENPAVMDAMFHSLRLRGVFERISGLILGRFATRELTKKMTRLIPTVVNRPDIPIIYDVDIGHVSPMLSIPLGARTVLNLDEKIQWEVHGY